MQVFDNNFFVNSWYSSLHSIHNLCNLKYVSILQLSHIDGFKDHCKIIIFKYPMCIFDYFYNLYTFTKYFYEF